MLRRTCIILGLIIVFSFCFADNQISKTTDEFFQKPIKIIVYTEPGGLIEVTARKFSDIASRYSDIASRYSDIASKYFDTNFIIENKPGEMK